MTSKQFYRNYLADDNLSELNNYLIDLILLHNPQNVFEFGCGSGKNLVDFERNGIVTAGLDISPQNITVAHYRNKLPFLMIGDESHLGHLSNFDVAFTVSVLDHIEDITKIIEELKRIAPVVFLAETNDIPAEFYYPHNYESFGFEKIDFSWIGEDGAIYHIWKFSN